MFDVEGREGNEIVFVVVVEVENDMPELLGAEGSREGGFGGGVAFELID